MGQRLGSLPSHRRGIPEGDPKQVHISQVKARCLQPDYSCPPQLLCEHQNRSPCSGSKPHMQNISNTSFLTSTKSLLTRLQFSTDTSILESTLQPQAWLPQPFQPQLSCLPLRPPSLHLRSRRGSSIVSLHISQDRYHPTDCASLYTGMPCPGTAKASSTSQNHKGPQEII